MNLQFPGNVAAMGDDGVYGNAESVGNFLVRQSLDKADNDFTFAVGNGLAAFGIVDDLRYPRRCILSLYLLFEQTDGRKENHVLHLAVVLCSILRCCCSEYLRSPAIPIVLARQIHVSVLPCKS